MLTHYREQAALAAQALRQQPHDRSLQVWLNDAVCMEALELLRMIAAGETTELRLMQEARDE